MPAQAFARAATDLANSAGSPETRTVLSRDVPPATTETEFLGITNALDRKSVV